MKENREEQQKLERVITYLKNTKQVICNPYPVYDAEVFEALGMLKTDKNYMANWEKIADKPIEEMSKKEIATMLTFIERGERFSDGHIASFVESGELLRLMLRLQQLR